MVDPVNNVTISTPDAKPIPAGEPRPPPVGFVSPNVNSQEFEPPPPPYGPPPPYNPTLQQTPTHQPIPSQQVVTNWRPYVPDTRKRNAVGIAVIVFMVILLLTGLITIFVVQKHVQDRMSENWWHSSTEGWSLND